MKGRRGRSGSITRSRLCATTSTPPSPNSKPGAQFTQEVKDQGFGLTTMLKVPGAGDVMVYQPRHAVAYEA